MARRVSSPAFVGRGEELEALRAALARAAAGEAGALLVAGESGVGKSRLLVEFETVAAAEGARLLTGACIDVGGSELPYAPLVAAVRTVARETDPETLAELLGAGAQELARLLPELPPPSTDAAVDPLAQSRLFEALLGLLSRLSAAAPVVLAVEDIHWADPSTRAFLAFLVRNMRGERLLLVATYRTDELHSRHPLRQFLADVERVPTVDRLELRRFTRGELAAQLAAILDAPVDAGLLDELYARSQGNAFFAEELLAAAGEGGPGGVPDSLRDALTLRVQGLSEETRALLRVAAAAGSMVGHRLLAATAGLSDDELARTVREAIEHNVLVRDAGGQSYAFRHALLREALHDDLLPGEGAALHAALARALEHDPSLAIEAHGAAAERASHWYAAHELAAALAASLEAAAEAERVWAFAEANRHLERAVEVWERVPADARPQDETLVDLVRRAAEAAHLAGQNERAVALCRRALRLLDVEREPVEAGLVRERLARYLLAQGLALEALDEYRAAAALVPAEPSEAHASILAGQGHVLMLEGDPERSAELCEKALEIARAVGATVVECNVLNTLGADRTFLGTSDEGLELLWEAKRLAEELGAFEELVRSYVNLGESLDQANRLEEATALALEGWERLRHRVGTVALFLVSEAAARLVRLGRWDEAAAHLREAGEPPAGDLGGLIVLTTLGHLEVLRGELDSAAVHLERARRAAGDVVTSMWTTLIPEALATLALARHRPEAARALLADVDGDGEPGTGYAVFLLPRLAVGLRAEAELAAQARADRDEEGESTAVARAAKLLEQVRRLVAEEHRSSSHVDTMVNARLCELEAARTRGEATADDWARLAARCDEVGRPYLSAYARLREAEAAVAAGLPRSQIGETLAPAREIAAQLGAQPLLAEIEELAQRARLDLGDAAGPDAAAEAAGLTARELDVLRLVAEGKTNPEIGRALYMSPKTASVHVSRILAKLGVRSRVEAAGVAHRLRLIEPAN